MTKGRQRYIYSIVHEPSGDSIVKDITNKKDTPGIISDLVDDGYNRDELLIAKDLITRNERKV